MVSKSSTKGPFVAVHGKPEADIRPLNGHRFSEEAMLETGLTPEEVELMEQEQQIEARRVQIQQRKEAAQAEAQNKLLTARDKAKEAAANFRREARKCTDEAEKRSLYEWATEADNEVRQIELELGIAHEAGQDSAPEDNKSFFERNRLLTALLQVVGVLVAILYFHGKFNSFRAEIETMNQGLAVEKQLQPYDETSIQKLVYEKLVVFVDLPIALLVLFLVVPFVGFYVLPFLKSRKDFYTEFFEDLTPWQRSIITTVFSLGLLFFLALSHNVKP